MLASLSGLTDRPGRRPACMQLIMDSVLLLLSAEKSGAGEKKRQIRHCSSFI